MFIKKTWSSITWLQCPTSAQDMLLNKPWCLLMVERRLASLCYDNIKKITPTLANQVVHAFFPKDSLKQVKKNFIHKTISKIPSTLEKFENPALFVWLSLTSTPICQKNRAFQKELQTRLIWKRQLCIFVQTKNILVTEPFDWFPFPCFLQSEIQND